MEDRRYQRGLGRRSLVDPRHAHRVPERIGVAERIGLRYWKPDEVADIVNNRARHRYELPVDGHIAATYYAIADGVITFIHTEVPPELGGQGIASKLIRGALDQVRAEGLKVIAQCPFVKAYIDKHPEYADLLKA